MTYDTTYGLRLERGHLTGSHVGYFRQGVTGCLEVSKGIQWDGWLGHGSIDSHTMNYFEPINFFYSILHRLHLYS
jgi:hypothetical protein